MNNPLPPGPELDRLLAKEVFGYQSRRMSDNLSSYPDDERTYVWYEITTAKGQRTVPSYSADIASAWHVVDKLKERFPHILVGTNPLTLYGYEQPEEEHSGKPWAAFGNTGEKINDIAVYGESIPHAICLAALKAITK